MELSCSISKGIFCSLLIGVFAFPISGMAAKTSFEQSQATVNSKTNYRETTSRWAIFGGIGTGYNSVAGSEYQSAPNGTPFVLSGLLSFQIPKWVFDVGASWFYSSLSGHNIQNNPITIRTRTGMLDVSPRYRISQRWQLGPVFNFAFGTDTSFGPSVGNSVGTSFLGAKVVYEIPNESFPIRLWSQVSTDVSISERNVLLAMAGIQIGIPFYTSSGSSEKQPRIEMTSSTPRRAPNQDLVVTLDPQKVFFSTNSASLRPDVKEILKTVGQYLDADDKNWDLVEIVGHADRRGKFDYNLKLSQKRARSVKKALTEGGASSKKMKTDAYGYLKPTDARNNQAGWAQNRRVELTFHNVDHPEVLIKKLEPLMSQKPLKSSHGES